MKGNCGKTIEYIRELPSLCIQIFIILGGKKLSHFYFSTVTDAEGKFKTFNGREFERDHVSTKMQASAVLFARSLGIDGIDYVTYTIYGMALPCCFVALERSERLE